MKDYIEIKNTKYIRLKGIPTRLNPRYKSKDEYNDLLDHNRACIDESQTLLYANHKSALLIIFQGMDTAGKDGAIKHVMSGINPQGCSVVSFKSPTPEELEHDFLWRVNRVLPERGMIGIFNRSYYEEVLITRVHPEMLKNEKLPTGNKHDKEFWTYRYKNIVDYEDYLGRQGFNILKIFIHISKNEQKSRLMDRFNDPKKIWKISEGDVRERSFWKSYQSVYESCLHHTSTRTNPWYILPGDDKESARLSISQILVDRFKKMHLTYPRLTKDEKHKLRKLKSILKEDK